MAASRGVVRRKVSQREQKGLAGWHLIHLGDAVNNVVQSLRCRQGPRDLQRRSDSRCSVNGRHERERDRKAEKGAHASLCSGTEASWSVIP